MAGYMDQRRFNLTPHPNWHSWDTISIRLPATELVLEDKSPLQVGQSLLPSFIHFSSQGLQIMWPLTQQGTGTSLGIRRQTEHCKLSSISLSFLFSGQIHFSSSFSFVVAMDFTISDKSLIFHKSQQIVTRPACYKRELATYDHVTNDPLLTDPYECRMVKVAPSKVPGRSGH